jgi:hypothetical protein
VNKVLYDEQKQKATGVEILDTETKQTEEFYANIIFLNAATVATAFILLNSTSNRFPNGLGNGSDQVGRNLMDHHKGLSISASVDGFEEVIIMVADQRVFIFRDLKMYTNLLRFSAWLSFCRRCISWSSAHDATIGADLKDALTEPGAWVSASMHLVKHYLMQITALHSTAIKKIPGADQPLPSTATSAIMKKPCIKTLQKQARKY